MLLCTCRPMVEQGKGGPGGLITLKVGKKRCQHSPHLLFQHEDALSHPPHSKSTIMCYRTQDLCKVGLKVVVLQAAHCTSCGGPHQAAAGPGGAGRPAPHHHACGAGCRHRPLPLREKLPAEPAAWRRLWWVFPSSLKTCFGLPVLMSLDPVVLFLQDH